MSTVDTVAEAIWRATVPAAAEKGLSFSEMAESTHKVFRVMAQAAIDSLQLKQEIGGATTDALQEVSTHVDLESAQEACDRFNRVSSYHAVPVTRLVSPWQEVGQ